VSERTRRIDHLLQEEISAIVQRELEDPRVGFVTITSVETTPDLHHATVYASIIGDEAERKATMAALGRAKSKTLVPNQALDTSCFIFFVINSLSYTLSLNTFKLWVLEYLWSFRELLLRNTTLHLSQ
jgi:ribosome-binding factor A